MYVAWISRPVQTLQFLIDEDIDIIGRWCLSSVCMLVFQHNTAMEVLKFCIGNCRANLKSGVTYFPYV